MFHFYLYYSFFAANHHFMIVHKDRNRPYICHPFASPVIILCQDGKRCEAVLNLCIVDHDVGTSSLKVEQFPVESFVMGIANCMTCDGGSGDADTLFAHLLLTALNIFTGVYWNRRLRKTLGNKVFSQFQFICHYLVKF